MRLALETVRRIEEHVPLLIEYYSVSRPVWPILREILSLPHVAPALRAMHQTGVLLAHLSRVARDRVPGGARLLSPVHGGRAYARGHRAIASLRDTKLEDRKRFATLLAESEAQLPIVYLALLFHDCGKSDGLEAHAARSARLAAGAFERIQVPAEVS